MSGKRERGWRGREADWCRFGCSSIGLSFLSCLEPRPLLQSSQVHQQEIGFLLVGMEWLVGQRWRVKESFGKW